MPFAPLPAAILGVFTMAHFHVPRTFWLMNLIFVILGTVASVVASRRSLSLNLNPVAIVVVSTLLLLATFLDDGIMAVHRWINFYMIRLNIGLIVSPLILIHLARISSGPISMAIGVTVTVIFLMQPDASLVAAFSIASVVILYRKQGSDVLKLSFLIFVIAAVLYSWYSRDSLDPVSYVEGIMDLVNEISTAIFVAAIISLLLLISPFLIDLFKMDTLSLSLATYLFMLLLSSFLGNFPVMIMGYGVSPIVGYYIALTAQISRDTAIRSSTLG